MAKKQIYREVALSKLDSPEELDKLIRVTDLRAWLALGGGLFLILLALAWGIVGSIPDVIQASGVLVRPGGIQQVRISQTGQLTEVSVKAGDQVKTNQVIAKLKPADASPPVELRSPADGTVLDVSKDLNTTLRLDSLIATIESTSQPLQGLILVPLNQSKRLKAGTDVQINPAAATSRDNDYLVGKVSYVYQAPVTEESLPASFPISSKGLSEAGPLVKVEVNLGNNLKWSSGKNPQGLVLTSGTPATAVFKIGEQSPLSLILPVFRGQGEG